MPVAALLNLVRVVSVGGALVSIFLVLLSGTLMVDGDVPFLLGRLSMLTFKGVVPSPDDPTTTYRVTVLWFLNALGFTYPLAPKEYQTAGMLYNVDGFLPGGSLTLPMHLVDAARRVDLPDDHWRCLATLLPPSHRKTFRISQPNTYGFCTNDFFGKWAASHAGGIIGPVVFPTGVALAAYYVALFMLLWVRTAKGMGLAAAALGLAAAWSSWMLLRAAAYLERVDLPGMEVRIGGDFLMVTWGAAAMGLLGWLLTMARERSMKGRGALVFGKERNAERGGSDGMDAKTEVFAENRRN